MSRVLAVILILFIAVLGITMTAPSFIDWNAHKSKIREEVKKHTDLDIEIEGDLDFAVLPSPVS